MALGEQTINNLSTLIFVGAASEAGFRIGGSWNTNTMPLSSSALGESAIINTKTKLKR